MQSYALQKGSLVSAREASRKKNYRCPECDTSLRLRGGVHRRAHFYHVRRSLHCRQHQRGPAHLALQHALQALFPPGELTMERPFPEIRRVADLSWEKERIVFEIQCSAMSAQEAASRSHDYRSVGYTCVWLLHEERFNRKKLSLTENYLRQRELAYYTGGEKKGEPLVYDQTERRSLDRRGRKGPPLPVLLTEPQRREGRLYFRGDLTDRFGRGPLPTPAAPVRLSWGFWLRTGARALWHSLLMRACR